MLLAGMLAADRAAVICDMAETYHIYDLYTLPPATIAMLAVGLRDDSRIKLKIAGAVANQEIMLLAAAVDQLSMMVWMQSKDGKKNKNRPPSILDAINGRNKENDQETIAFESYEDFERARARIIGR